MFVCVAMWLQFLIYVFSGYILSCNSFIFNLNTWHTKCLIWVLHKCTADSLLNSYLLIRSSYDNGFALSGKIMELPTVFILCVFPNSALNYDKICIFKICPGISVWYNLTSKIRSKFIILAMTLNFTNLESLIQDLRLLFIVHQPILWSNSLKH